jgi:hypothetical protein
MLRELDISWMESPPVLRARAAMRRELATQDLAWGDQWSSDKNLAEASRLEGKADAVEGKKRT